MTANRHLDLVCVSYLADAQVLRVVAYPPANHGAVVRETISSIAADGPLAALSAASLGLRVGLVAGRVGADPAGLTSTPRCEPAAGPAPPIALTPRWSCRAK